VGAAIATASFPHADVDRFTVRQRVRAVKNVYEVRGPARAVAGSRRVASARISGETDLPA